MELNFSYCTWHSGHIQGKLVVDGIHMMASRRDGDYGHKKSNVWLVRTLYTTPTFTAEDMHLDNAVNKVIGSHRRFQALVESSTRRMGS